MVYKIEKKWYLIFSFLILVSNFAKSRHDLWGAFCTRRRSTCHFLHIHILLSINICISSLDFWQIAFKCIKGEEIFFYHHFMEKYKLHVPVDWTGFQLCQDIYPATTKAKFSSLTTLRNASSLLSSSSCHLKNIKLPYFFYPKPCKEYQTNLVEEGFVKQS